MEDSTKDRMRREAEADEAFSEPEWPHANELRSLIQVTAAALGMSPPRYLRSIFGGLRSWAPPHRRFSEYNILNPWRPLTSLRFISDITLPAFPTTAPNWARTVFPPVVNRRLWRPTDFFRQPDEYGGVSTFPDERWFFINGIMTNADLARINAAYLAHLFHRPLTVVQNATDSALVDLFECAIGKGFKNDPDSADRKTMTEPAWRATTAILEAINAPQTKRVVVIAHSQGTIITANVLRAVAKALRSNVLEQLEPRWHDFTDRLMGGVETEIDKVVRDNLAHSLAQLTKGGLREALLRLAKLEVYTFANCADRMRYVLPTFQLPYMEHFANERDIVARLGVLSPLRGDGPESEAPIEIDGPTFMQRGAWGHLLNDHYLTPIDHYLYPGSRRYRREEDPYPAIGQGPQESRLYGYFHGKRLADLPPPSTELATRLTGGDRSAN
jgi:hypothetical protein